MWLPQRSAFVFILCVGLLSIVSPASAQSDELFVQLYEVSDDPRCSAETLICPLRDTPLDPADTLAVLDYTTELQEDAWVSEIIDKCVDRRAVVWRCEELELESACDEWEWLQDAEDYLDGGACVSEIRTSTDTEPSPNRLALMQTLVSLLRQLALLLLQLQAQNL